MTEQRTADGVQLEDGSTATCDESGLGGAATARRAADRRRVGPPVFPRPPGRRRVDRAGAARRTDRVRHAAVRQRRASCCSRCRCRCRRSSGTRTRSASSRCRISATSRCRRTSAPRRPPSTRRCTAKRSRSSSCCSGAARSSHSDGYLPYRMAFDVEKLTWELDFFVTPLPRGLPRRRADARPSGRRSPRNGRRSSRSSRPSRACCAIATTTAAI